MKFALATIAATFAVASAKKVPVASKDITPGAIKADSKLGMRVLSEARQLDQNNENEEIEYTWVADYSIKFQGCHHISQWNEDANDEDEPKIQTKRLVRFRLCPTSSCTYENAGGCDSSYGDYIIDMDTFLGRLPLLLLLLFALLDFFVPRNSDSTPRRPDEGSLPLIVEPTLQSNGSILKRESSLSLPSSL